MNKLIIALVLSCFLVAAVNGITACTQSATTTGCRACECTATNVNCRLCNSMYYFGSAAGTTCAACTGNCLTCAVTAGATSTCASCKPGFGGTTCAACTAIANAAASSTTCSFSGIAVGVMTSKCTAGQTIANCASYKACAASGSTGNTCDICELGYFLAADFLTCTACPTITNCFYTSPHASYTCTAATVAGTTCGVCKSGYYAVAGSCTACVWSTTAAEVCPTAAMVYCSTALDARCSACGDGKYSDSTQKCLSCTAITNCDAAKHVCTSSSNQYCSACSAGTAYPQCVRFSACVTGTSTANTCSQCATGYWLKTDFTCAVHTTIVDCVAGKTWSVPSSTGVASEPTAKVCSECSSGKFLQPGSPSTCTTTCTLTGCASPVCSTTSTTVYCVSCDITTQGILNVLGCAKHATCATCTSGTTYSTCQTCNDGFFLDSNDGVCSACPAQVGWRWTGCVNTCSSSGTPQCLTCATGFTATTIVSTGATAGIYCTANPAGAGGAAAASKSNNLLFLSLSVMLAFLALLI